MCIFEFDWSYFSSIEMGDLSESMNQMDRYHRQIKESLVQIEAILTKLGVSMRKHKTGRVNDVKL